MWKRPRNKNNESDVGKSDVGESDDDSGCERASDDGGSASSSGDHDEENGESRSDSTSSDDDVDEDADLPDANDPCLTSLNTIALRPMLTLTNQNNSAVMRPQLTHVVGALLPLCALHILLTTANEDASVIARMALWAARVSKQPRARPLPVVLLVAKDVRETLRNRNVAEHVMAELRRHDGAELAVATPLWNRARVDEVV